MAELYWWAFATSMSSLGALGGGAVLISIGLVGLPPGIASAASEVASPLAAAAADLLLGGGDGSAVLIML